MLKASRERAVMVVGLGYIGLPTAAVLANHGVRVTGLDVSPHVVDTINRGEIHIVEPDLDKAVHAAVENGMLKASLEPVEADAFVIAVPTPFKGDDHEPDLSYIESASRAIATVLKAGDLVILESTSPVGATEQMAEWLAAARPDLSFPHQAGEDSDVRIAHCPERVLPGKVMEELITNDRIIGGMTPRCSTAATALYETFVKGDCISTSTRAAEMCKLAENAFRDVNIAFANELSLLCDGHDIDVWELIGLANRHPRVDILKPGAGVGGHCIAVDPWFIVSGAPDTARLIRTAREVNDGKPEWILDQVRTGVAAQREKGADPKICVLGLAFKPDIDDLRESPALEIAKIVAAEADTTVDIVEPNIEELPRGLDNARLVSLEEGMKADIVVALVRHREFLDAATDLCDRDGVVDAVGLTSTHSDSPVQASEPAPAETRKEFA